MLDTSLPVNWPVSPRSAGREVQAIREHPKNGDVANPRQFFLLIHANQHAKLAEWVFSKAARRVSRNLSRKADRIVPPRLRLSLVCQW